jgi:hypothetical protein
VQELRHEDMYDDNIGRIKGNWLIFFI